MAAPPGGTACEEHFQSTRDATIVSAWLSVGLATTVLLLSLRPRHARRRRFPGRLVLVFLGVTIVFCGTIVLFGHATHWRHLLPDEPELAAVCHAQGFLFQVATMALILWWSVLGWLFWKACKQQTPLEELQKHEKSFHAVIWPVALASAVVPLAMGLYNFRTKMPYCWVGVERRGLWQYLFLFIPMLAATMAGLLWGGELLTHLWGVHAGEGAQRTSGPKRSKRLWRWAGRARRTEARRGEEGELDGLRAALLAETGATSDEGESPYPAVSDALGSEWSQSTAAAEEDRGAEEREEDLERAAPERRDEGPAGDSLVQPGAFSDQEATAAAFLPSFRDSAVSSQDTNEDQGAGLSVGATLSRTMWRHLLFILVFVAIFIINLVYAVVNSLGLNPTQSMCMATSVNNALVGVYAALVFWPFAP